MSPSAVVIGVGNIYRQDDGAGPAAVDLLRESVSPPGVTFAVCDGEPSRLIELWSRSELAIVIDALSVRSPRPGAIHRLDIEAVEASAEPPSTSHGLGLGTAVRLARELDRMPERLIVYAIEIEEYGFGPRMSGPVQRAVEHVAEHVWADLAELAAERIAA
ncbi:hydrogenase maturation protease [Glycomyces dulcitolivorans]|uniref:hydrogenase maturation protease n=1 Tax=Glycomyces dulcitolivorans TaxID=2200759 RepID=UPI000DD44C94|nr:hydrogenase maturation protease [Glycomyces dulcitolivorans]